MKLYTQVLKGQSIKMRDEIVVFDENGVADVDKELENWAAENVPNNFALSPDVVMTSKQDVFSREPAANGLETAAPSVPLRSENDAAGAAGHREARSGREPRVYGHSPDRRTRGGVRLSAAEMQKGLSRHRRLERLGSSSRPAQAVR